MRARMCSLGKLDPTQYPPKPKPKCWILIPHTRERERVALELGGWRCFTRGLGFLSVSVCRHTAVKLYMYVYVLRASVGSRTRRRTKKEKYVPREPHGVVVCTQHITYNIHSYRLCAPRMLWVGNERRSTFVLIAWVRAWMPRFITLPGMTTFSRERPPRRRRVYYT